MGSITIVRHGQASFGTDDYDRLSDLGHRQARWLSRHFDATGHRFDRIICGSLRRHRETAAPVAEAQNVEADVDPRLNEFDYDALAERYHLSSPLAPATSREEFLHLLPEIFFAWENDQLLGATEDYSSFQMRVDDAVDEALEIGQSVLIVSSGGPITATLRRVLALSNRSASDLLLNIHNASYHRFQFEGGRLRLSQFNASPHLIGPDRDGALTYV